MAGLTDESPSGAVSRDSCSWSMVLVEKGCGWSGGEWTAGGEPVAMAAPLEGAEGELTWESSAVRDRLSLARAFWNHTWKRKRKCVKNNNGKIKLMLLLLASSSIEHICDVTCLPYLQDSLGQAGLMCQAGPVFTVRVVLLGEIRLQRSELLAAETRPHSFGLPAGPSTCRPVVRSWLWAADRLLPFAGALVLSCTHTHTHRFVFDALTHLNNLKTSI